MIAEAHYEGRAAKALEALLRESGPLNRRLADEAAQAVREAHRIERLAGRDADGSPLVRVTARVGRYEGASGPPLAPFGEASRVLTGFFTNTVRAEDGFTLVAGYRGDVARILGYHRDGKSGSGRPVVRDGRLVGFRGIRGRTTGIRRDVFGIGPAGREGVREVLRAHTNRLARLLRNAAGRAATFFGAY